MIESHTAMRFAWLKKHAAQDRSALSGGTPLIGFIRMAYNLVFWIFLLPFVTTIDYDIGFMAFMVVIFVRLSANLYTNNVIRLNVEQFYRFPLRT